MRGAHCSIMMLKADWKRETQQKSVLLAAKRSTHSTSPHTGTVPWSRVLESKLTMITPIPYLRMWGGQSVLMPTAAVGAQRRGALWSATAA
jgi:hypothetical protein